MLKRAAASGLYQGMQLIPALAADYAPFPGDPWPDAPDAAAIRATEKKLAKQGIVVPAAPTAKAEIARAVALRMHEVYDASGNHPRDAAVLDGLIDVWVARRGVAFAVECAIGACRSKLSKPGAAYRLRVDGVPWMRLRQHLAIATPEERAKALAFASVGRTQASELPLGLAYTFTDPSADDLEVMIQRGYGALLLLAAIADADTARRMLKRLLGDDGYVAPFQLVEYAPPFLPTLLTRLDASDAPLVLRCAEQAWNKSVREPWLDLVRCVPGAAAKKWLAQHAPKPKAKTKPKPKKRAA